MITEMNFKFSDREDTDIQAVNDMLMAARFHNLEIKDFKGYLAECKEYDSDGKEKNTAFRYGFDSLTLSCETDGEAKSARYQIAAEVIPDSESSQQVYMRWQREYPERIMRSQTTVGFGNIRKNVAVILYCIDKEKL